MSATENVKQLKDQLNASLTDKQKQLSTDVADASKTVKLAKQNLKSAREAAKAAKESAKAAKVSVAEATANHQSVAAKLEASFDKKQSALKTQLSDTQRALMASRMGK